MKKYIALALMFASLLSTLQARTYAIVNGKPITEKDFEQAGIAPSFNYDKLSSGDKKAFMENFIAQYLIIEDAKAKKMDNNKELKDRLELVKRQLLIEAWQQEQLKNAQIPNITDAQVEEVYKQNEGQFIDQEGRARHIIVEKEDQAKAIINELNKVRGNVEPKFIDLANQKSIDPVNQEQKNGGDLGTFHRMQMLPEFSKACFDLKPGTYTKTPVKTQFGYHVIYLISKTEPKTMKKEQAKQIIMQNMQNEVIGKLINTKINDLRQKAKVEIK